MTASVSVCHSVMTKSRSSREPAMLRTGLLVTDQSESEQDSIISPVYLSDSDRMQL